jgi:hypothetical protein
MHAARAPSMVVYTVTLAASALVRMERESTIAWRFSSENIYVGI